jgi:Sigma 54 modulation protein / S30EA ribosomal protein
LLRRRGRRRCPPRGNARRAPEERARVFHARRVLRLTSCGVSKPNVESFVPSNEGYREGHILCDILSLRAVLGGTKMQIRVDVDDSIDSSEELRARVEGVVEGSLDRFQERIARVDVHLGRLRRVGYRDMCCRMEAHAGDLKLVAVSHEAVTLTEAIHAASAKLVRAVAAALGQSKPSDISRSADPSAEEGSSAEGLGSLRSS